MSYAFVLNLLWNRIQKVQNNILVHNNVQNNVAIICFIDCAYAVIYILC